MSSFDPQKISDCHTELIDVFNKHKLTEEEIVLTYGNLVYTLGASMGGYSGKGPALEALKKMYYSNPTLDVALMLQGILITTWYDDHNKQQAAQPTKETT